MELKEHKEIVLDSLKFLVEEKRIKLYAFVIMPNHIHLIWLIKEGHILKNVQRDMLKFTAQQIRFSLINSGNKLLDDLVVYSKDRKTQIWERNGHSFPLHNPETIMQKLNYIHSNPINEKWRLSDAPSEYFYSSASFYETEIDTFKMLSHTSEML